MTETSLQQSRLAPTWRHEAEKIWVVLPAYNEEDDLPPLLERIDQAMHLEKLEYEVIIVDDGSSDRTPEIVRRYAALMPLRHERHPVNQGLGPTIRDGLKKACDLAADKDIIIALDSDNTHTPWLMRRMVQIVREGADVVTASRYQDGSQTVGVPPLRHLLTFGVRVLFRLIFPIEGVRDYSCGYRAYRVTALKRAFDHYGERFINQAGFQAMADILLKMSMMPGVTIFREVPMILRYDLKGGVSKMRVARTVVRTLKLLLKRRFGSLS